MKPVQWVLSNHVTFHLLLAGFPIYSPLESEWLEYGIGTECERIIRGIEQIMELDEAKHLIDPLDLDAQSMAHPMNLSLIKSRLEKRFYRYV